jgi:alpha-D-ribose 1-methylphosphonate 5-triphosphate synthase subunit PhnG
MGIGIVATILLIGNRYADDGYQALSEHRRAGTKLDFLTMVRGRPLRG